MAKAILCPVCNGTGKVTKYPTPNSTGVTYEYDETCHGCGGKGWVEVADDPAPYVPYPYYIPPVYPYPGTADPYPWYPNTTYPDIIPPYVVTCHNKITGVMYDD